MNYREQTIAEMRNDGYDEDFILDWVRIYDETGLDLRDMSDGMDVDAFLDAYEEWTLMHSLTLMKKEI